MALVVASFIVVSARKIYEYAAAPDKDKESNFVFPYNSEQKPTILIAEPKAQPITFKQTGGFTNDASHLNQTAIYGVINIKREDDIRNALQYARENKLKITCAGQQHSMGGQTFTHGGLLLDLREFNRITRAAKAHLPSRFEFCARAKVKLSTDIGEDRTEKLLQTYA